MSRFVVNTLPLGLMVSCRPLVNTSPPFKGLNIRIHITIPIKERGFIHRGSTLGCDKREILLVFHNEASHHMDFRKADMKQGYVPSSYYHPE